MSLSEMLIELRNWVVFIRVAYGFLLTTSVTLTTDNNKINSHHGLLFQFSFFIKILHLFRDFFS